jgi:Phosphotransferase enzyme family
VISREQLGGDTVNAICACYELGAATEQSLVYKGTSSVYRLVCLESRRINTYALKVEDRDASFLSAKRLEAELLGALSPAFPRVPVLVRPSRSYGPMQSQGWGLLWGDRAISAYRWVDSLPYAGTLQQLRAAARCFGELQNKLSQLSLHPKWKSRAAALDSLLDAPSAGFLPDFLASEKARSDAHQAAGLSYGDLKFLQEQREIARAELAQSPAHLQQAERALLHAELTPPNCGYDENGEVRVIFDFESARFGLVPLAGALAIGTFSLVPSAGARENVRRIVAMSGELRSVCLAASPAAAMLLPLLRLAYLDAAWRQLGRRRTNSARGWGYLRGDIENLRWLKENARLVAGQ